ncbi:unnamed protein product [Laminaria digitata]
MRASNAVVQICGVIYEVVGAFKTEAPDMAAFALETLRKYIGWIDIAQVVNERFLNLFAECLRSPDEQVVQRSCSCILEVVNKKMADPVSKLRLLQQLKLAEMLKQVPLSDESVAVRVAELVDGVIKQLLSVWDKLEPAALGGSGLTGSAPSTSIQSTPGVTGGESGGVGWGGAGRRFRAMDHLPQLLSTLYQRMKYPLDFAFDPSDEDEGEEDMLRQQLRKHLVHAIRQAPTIVLDFLCRALSSLPTPLSALPFPDLEAALRLIFHFGEGCGGVSGLASGASGAGGAARRAASPNGAAELLRSGAFPQMVLALHDSDVAQHKHPQVLMLYFQLTVRYSKMLADGPPHLVPKILEVICGPQGLSNPDVTLRTRSCYFLTKLVKAMKDGVVPYIDAIVPGVQALLGSRGSGLDLSDEAKLNLYETIGYLIGMPDVPPAKQGQHLDAVLGPQMRRIAENLQAAAGAGVGVGGVGAGAGGGRGDKDDDAAATELAAAIGAMANVSKGFKAVVAAEVEARFFQALDAATSALMAFPQHITLRAKTMFLVHGLIPCLGEGLLRGLSLTALLALVQGGDGKDLMEVTQLLCQLTIEYGPKSAQLLDGALLPFIRRTHDLMPGVGSTTATAAASTPHGTGQALGEGPGSGPRANGREWPGMMSNGSSKPSALLSGGGGGGASAAVESGGEAELLAHEVAERAGIRKLYLSLLQHLSSNGLAGVLASPTNGSCLDGVLRSVLGGISGDEDASAKKTCFYIFSLLLGGFNRGRSGGTGAKVNGGGVGGGGGGAGGAAVVPGAEAGGLKAARAAAAQRRTLSGKGGGLWTGSGPTVDMPPMTQSAVTAFVLEEVAPAALKCLVDGAPRGLDLRDAMAVGATVHMGALFKEARAASGGLAGFVGSAALACSCTPQVAQQLQQAVEGAADGPAIAAALKAFAQHMRPAR